jgi:hypothetical protein
VKKNAMLAGFYITSIAMTVGAAIPLSWDSRGVGGGGALFSPSINPANDSEFYVGCDMSELFHSTDFGASYTTVPFHKIQGGHNSSVRFTNNPLIRYCISYTNDQPVPVISADKGATWRPLSGNPDNTEEPFGIFADYNNPLRVIFSTYGYIYFSADSGKNCALAHTASDNNAGVVVGGAFFDGNLIVLGTNDGLIVSTDGGAHFAVQSVAGIPATERIFSFAGAKQSGVTRFFCLTGNASGIYVGLVGSDYYNFVKGVYSLDYGSGSWTPRMTGITPGTDFPMFVAMAGSDITTAYLAGSNSSGTPTVLKTTNSGASWTHVFNATGNQNVVTGWSGEGGDRGWGYGECAFGVAVAPASANKALISDFGFMHKTSDGGLSWQQAYVAVMDAHPAGASTPAKRSYHSVGLENTTCWQVVWADSADMFACFSDIKGVRSVDAGTTWSFNYSGHSANTMYRLVKGSAGALYAGTSNIHDIYQSTRLSDAVLDANDPEGKVMTSADKGATWQLVHAFGHPVFWVAPDPGDQHTLYASVVHSTLGGVYVTHDLQNGASSVWIKLPNPPRTQAHPACIVALNDGKAVCTYSGRRTATAFTACSGVFIYTPSANSWADVSNPGMQYWTKDIIVDSHDATQSTWYVAVFSGWGGPPDGLGGLYKTINRGQSWMKINSLDRVTSCAISPDDPAEAYLTTETEGLWHSANFTAASPVFTRVDNYPFRQPERVFFNPYNKNEIWVSSFGNGMRVGQQSGSTVLERKAAAAARQFAFTYANGRLVIDLKENTTRQVPVSVIALDGRVVFRSVVGGERAGGAVLKTGPLHNGVYGLKIGGLPLKSFIAAK